MKTEEAENDKYSEKESSDAFAVTVQEKTLVDAKEEKQSEAQIREVTADIVEQFMQTEILCMNAGDDDMLQQCYKEIALLEYLLINSEYDREVTADERIQYSEQEQKDILETDGVKERLVDSLENSSENSLGKENQHTDVLIVEENSEQHTEVLAKEDKALMPSDFYSNKCFVNAGIVAEHLTQLSSQMKEEEVFCSRRQEGMDDRVVVRTKTSIEERSQQVTIQIEKVKTEQAVLAQQAARNQQPRDYLDREIESIRRLMTKESRKRPAATRKKRKDNKRKTAKDCKSTTSGALQHKIWKPGR